MLERLHKKVQVKKTREAPVKHKFNVVPQKPVHGAVIIAPDSSTAVDAKTSQKVGVEAAGKLLTSSKAKSKEPKSVKKPKKPAKSPYRLQLITKLPPTPCIKTTSSAPSAPNPYAKVVLPKIIHHAPAEASTPLRNPPPKIEKKPESFSQTATNKSAYPWNPMKSPAASKTWKSHSPLTDKGHPDDIAATAFGWETNTLSANFKKTNPTPRIDMSKPRNRISVIPEPSDQSSHETKSM